jgi:hypothetical protein
MDKIDEWVNDESMGSDTLFNIFFEDSLRKQYKPAKVCAARYKNTGVPCTHISKDGSDFCGIHKKTPKKEYLRTMNT